MSKTDRGDCPMRHKNGNCTVAGGFCTAVNDPICEALHNAYNCGRRYVDPIHEAGGRYCRECENLHMENITINKSQPFTETAFREAIKNGEFIILHCTMRKLTRDLADFCSYCYRMEDTP